MEALLAQVDATVFDRLGTSDRPIVYRSGRMVEAAIQGIFDEVAVEHAVGEPGIMSQAPTVFVRLADLTTDPELDRDAQVVVGSVAYWVKEVEKDGKGHAILRLRREDPCIEEP